MQVSFTDDAGSGETLSSAATAAVVARPNNPATGAPSITGTAQVGETLSADTSVIADADGLANVSYSYQWIRNDGGTDSNISGATHSSYTLAADDEGRRIKVQVSFTDDAGNGETLSSAATAAVVARPKQSGHGSPEHHRHGPGRRDSLRRHLRHRRRRRAGQRFLQLPVDTERRRNG